MAVAIDVRTAPDKHIGSTNWEGIGSKKIFENHLLIT